MAFGSGSSVLGVTFTGMNLVGVDGGAPRDSALARNNNGAPIVASDHRFNIRDEITETWEAEDPAGSCLGGAITLVSGTTAITNITITMEFNRYVRATITGHTHATGTHDGSASITLPSANGFGVTQLIISPFTDADCQRLTYVVSVDHIDKQNNVGNHLIGRTYGLKEELTIEAITDAAPSAPGGDWEVDDIPYRKVNEDYIHYSLRASRVSAP